ncbi:MAG: ribokinase [Parcubacteria bacterium C7867-006]|nr:MAG: ribokinase [Parcubacteria bacterium C7867-006]
MKNIDILAIGDIVVDAFIKMNDAEVKCDDHNKNCKLCVRYGDKVPYESVEICYAVGNSANAAVSASRLGLSSALYAYVGDDKDGKECLTSLQNDKVETKYVHIDPANKTNYHYVLWYDVDRTILVKHEHYKYDFKVEEAPRWIYLSSLGDNTFDFQMQIVDFVESHPETKLAFQPGTFQIKMGAKELERIYKNSEIFFCNVEESQKILNETSRDLPTLMKGISALGPKTVVITDGFEGAYAFESSTGDMWFMSVYPHTPIDRTGAGDAYASTVVSILAQGKTLGEALTWAPINAMSVTQHVGAQKGLLSPEKIEEYLAKAPEDYKIKKI